MGILLGFAPFIAFAVLSGTLSPSTSLWIAAAVSVIPILKEVARKRSIKVLEIGTLALFAGLAVYTGLAHAHWEIWAVRTIVDSGLLLIVLLSMVSRRPFTLQYAREQVPSAVAQTAEFVRVNYIITAVWAVSMTLIVAIDLALQYGKLMRSFGMVMTLAALVFAFWFTSWYPQRLRAQH